jgi:hypothetical protein
MTDLLATYLLLFDCTDCGAGIGWPCRTPPSAALEEAGIDPDDGATWCAARVLAAVAAVERRRAAMEEP